MIFDQQILYNVSPSMLDSLLATGWRHFGVDFYRYSINIHEGAFCEVWPLRVQLEKFQFSKSQRKIVKRGDGKFQTVVRPAFLDDAKDQLFLKHRKRFKENIPEAITDFVSYQPGKFPTEAKEVAVYDQEKLIAVSFFDFTLTSASSIYAFFDTDYSNESLGIYTLLKEIEYAIARGLNYQYLGYGYNIRSFYDYKKKFSALQRYDWEGKWIDLPKEK